MPTSSITTKKEKMADTLTLVKQCIDKKIGLSDKINALIEEMDKAHLDPKNNYSPSNLISHGNHRNR